MQTVTPQSGLRWIQLGWHYFASQPALLLALFFGNLFLMLLISMVPLVGGLVPLILAPAASMATLSACALIARKQAFEPGLLFIGYRSPSFPNLLRLGVVYCLAMMALLAIVHWGSDGQLWKMMSGKVKIQPGDAPPPGALQGMLLLFALYPAITLLFWFCAPLVMWQRMTVGKALFFNFFAIWRARAAFLVFGLGWLTMGLFLPMLAIGIAGKVLGSPNLAAILALGLSFLIKVVIDCSCFAGYQQIFGDPETVTKIP